MDARRGLPLVLAVLLAAAGCGHGPGRPAALPDSARSALLRLEREHDYFRLRDHLKAQENRDGLYALYLRAVAVNAFGREAAADSLLDRLEASGATLPDSLGFLAGRLRYQNDLRFYQWADALRDARALMASPFADSARRSDLANTARLLQALRDVPPQSVESRRGGTLHPDDHGGVAVSIDSTPKRYAFDSGANFSVLMRSEAESLGLDIRPAYLQVGSSTDLRVRADLAVADRVQVGGATLRHVVFLVFPDSALTLPGVRIPGLLGFPIQRALGALAYHRDGTITVPAAPASEAPGTLAFHRYTPFVSVTFRSDTLSCQLDTGSGTTVLFEPYYRAHRAWVDSVGRADTVTVGGTGGIRRLPVAKLPRVTLGIAGTPVQMDSLEVRTSLPSWQDPDLMCLVGRDALGGFSTYVIDYEHMALVLSGGAAQDQAAPRGFQESPRQVLDSLPAISEAEQCAAGTCDHDVEARVFGTLDSLGNAVLTRGLPIAKVRELLGDPPDRYMAPVSFEDARHGHRITIWTYAVSLSGTYEYYLAFIDGCLDDFGRMQVSRLFAVYGRSGHSSEAVRDRDYRPGKGAGPTCSG